VRSEKGEREAARILDAATAVLAREGFGGATLGRIAAEAGVDKKMVVYYFSGRERLLAEVVARVGQQLVANMRAAAVELSEPSALVDVGVSTMWEASVDQPGLARAYLALATNSEDSPGVRQALRALKRNFEDLFVERLAILEAQGHLLSEDRDGYVKLMLAILRGLVMDWAEDGDTPALLDALEQFKRVAVAPFAAAHELSLPSES
jgi:AcrR family transcriptional regulator